jgi:hypothetical protein
LGCLFVKLLCEQLLILNPVGNLANERNTNHAVKDVVRQPAEKIRVLYSFGLGLECGDVLAY